jgi:hypothetical protein
MVVECSKERGITSCRKCGITVCEAGSDIPDRVVQTNQNAVYTNLIKAMVNVKFVLETTFFLTT